MARHKPKTSLAACVSEKLVLCSLIPLWCELFASTMQSCSFPIVRWNENNNGDKEEVASSGDEMKTTKKARQGADSPIVNAVLKD